MLPLTTRHDLAHSLLQGDALLLHPHSPSSAPTAATSPFSSSSSSYCRTTSTSSTFTSSPSSPSSRTLGTSSSSLATTSLSPTNLICLHRASEAHAAHQWNYSNDSGGNDGHITTSSSSSTTVSLHFPSKRVAPLTLHLATCANDHILQQQCEVCGGGGSTAAAGSASVAATSTAANASIGSGVTLFYLSPTYSLDATYEVAIPAQLQHLLDYREFTLAIDQCNAACALNSTWPWLFFIIGVIMLIICCMLPSALHFHTSSPEGIVCVVSGILCLIIGYIYTARKCKQLEQRRLQKLCHVIEEENKKEVALHQQHQSQSGPSLIRPMLRWSLLKLFKSTSSFSSSAASSSSTARHIQIEILCQHGIGGVAAAIQVAAAAAAGVTAAGRMSDAARTEGGRDHAIEMDSRTRMSEEEREEDRFFDDRGMNRSMNAAVPLAALSLQPLRPVPLQPQHQANWLSYSSSHA